jgi:hypothetical protein
MLCAPPFVEESVSAHLVRRRSTLSSPAASSPNSLHVVVLTILFDGTNRRVTSTVIFDFVDSDYSVPLWWICQHAIPQ